MQYTMLYLIIFQGLKSYSLYLLEIVYLLFQGNLAEFKKRNHQYKQFNSFSELQQYAEHSSDSQLQHEIRVCKISKSSPDFDVTLSLYLLPFSSFSLSLSIQICQHYRTNLLQIIKQLRKQEVKELYSADVIFTTAHKSKGFEFDNVRLADDFLSYFDHLQSLDSKLSNTISCTINLEIFIVNTGSCNKLILQKCICTIKVTG